MEKYTKSIERLIAELDITLVSKSKNAVTFTLDNKTYNVKASTFVLDEQYDARTINLTVSADGKTCNLDVDAVDELSESSCKADLTGYDYDLRSIYDINDNVVAKAIDEYSKDNEEEFTDCILELAGQQEPIPSYEDWENYDLDDIDWSEFDDAALYKKNANMEKATAGFWRTYKRNMKELREIFK